MNHDPTPVLLVEDSASDALLVREALASVTGLGFALTHVERLSDALATLEREKVAVVLLDLGLPDGTDLEGLTRIQTDYPDVPILVLTSLADEVMGMRAMQQGAQDYLVKSDLSPGLLARAIRYGIERLQWQQLRRASEGREEQARELHSMTRLTELDQAQVTARLYGSSPLRESNPQEFDGLVERYGQLLELALRRRVYKEVSPLNEEVRQLASVLGFLRVGPRDVVEIHTRALKGRLESALEKKATAYQEEGRLLVLETMGQLVNYYRSQTLLKSQVNQ